MKFYILKHADNEFQIIGTRQYLAPLSTQPLSLRGSIRKRLPSGHGSERTVP